MVKVVINNMDRQNERQGHSGSGSGKICPHLENFFPLAERRWNTNETVQRRIVLEVEAKIEYIDLVRESGVYTEEEISAIERLILSGAAQYFKDVIDQVRDEQVQREISELLT